MTQVKEVIVVNRFEAIDSDRAIKAATELLVALGVDVTDEAIADTPKRLVSMYAELLAPLSLTPTTFENSSSYDELVTVTSIPFRSLCEHHMLPFFGVAHVAYVPRGRVIGLSKLARYVSACSQGLQIQERLTVAIADEIELVTDAEGVGVVIDADHTCMTIRGIRSAGARTTTSAFRGSLREGPLRSEFLSRVAQG